MNPIKVWVIVNPEGEIVSEKINLKELHALGEALHSGCSELYQREGSKMISHRLKEGYTCQPMYLAPIEPSEDMVKEALPFEDDIEAIYTAMMESRDE